MGAGRRISVVSATNGKTTTTRLLAAAMTSVEPVLTNAEGSNLVRGVLSALMTDPHRSLRTCVFEVDELALTPVSDAVTPDVFVLGNLTRDQLDRTTEVRAVGQRWARLLAKAAEQAARTGSPAAVVVANCDDPHVAAALLSRPGHGPVLPAVWVAAGQLWTADAASCPRCARTWALRTDYHCGSCGFSRPTPDWALEGQHVVAPDGRRVELALALPGRTSRANAVMALAAADCLGASLDPALTAMREVSDVGGRYAISQYRGASIRMMLAKNPAGWQEMLARGLEEAGHTTPAPVVLVLNAQEADGRDTSWIWDVPFEQLAGREVMVAGERAEDLALRLRYADIPFVLSKDPLGGIEALTTRSGSGQVDLLANYTAFSSVSRRLAAR